MNLLGYYSSGQFARMAGVSLKTVRFYDKQNILKPSYRNYSGARFYTEEDFTKLQQILLLKYLSFSLEDIKDLLIDTSDHHLLLHSLKVQKKLVQDRIEQMQKVEAAIEDTVAAIEQEQQVDWSNMLELIHLTGMEKSMKNQYRDASNISARIRLHREYSVNQQGWFPWVYEQCALQENMQVLELGCGNGALWVENMDRLPDGVQVVLTDISEGMVRDAQRLMQEAWNNRDERKCRALSDVKSPQKTMPLEEKFLFAVCDCHKLKYENDSFDVVIANHLLFYCEDISKVLHEVQRVLKPGGRLVCSTYGTGHMKEITQLVQAFDSRIVLSAEQLYERFGLENGKAILEDIFGVDEVFMARYEDEIRLNRPELLMEYILSCHGNQNQFLLDKYKEFKNFITEKTRYGFKITKDAGVFIARK